MNLIVDYYMLHKVLDKIMEIIGIAKLGDSKILIDTDHELQDNITFRNVICIIKDDDKFYPQIFCCMVIAFDEKDMFKNNINLSKKFESY